MEDQNLPEGPGHRPPAGLHPVSSRGPALCSQNKGGGGDRHLMWGQLQSPPVYVVQVAENRAEAAPGSGADQRSPLTSPLGPGAGGPERGLGSCLSQPRPRSASLPGLLPLPGGTRVRSLGVWVLARFRDLVLSLFRVQAPGWGCPVRVPGLVRTRRLLGARRSLSP